MSNKDNLKPLSSSKAREIGSKGGKASVEARRKRKAMREQMEMLLSLPVKSPKLKKQLEEIGINANEIDNQMALVVSLYQTALKGGKNSVNAFNTIMSLTETESNQSIGDVKEVLVKIKEVANNDTNN